MPRDTILNGSIQELLNLYNYSRHFPDFPKDFTSIKSTPDNLPVPRHGEGYKAAFIIFAIASTIAVFARIWTRKRYQRVPLWWDDYMACYSLVCIWALSTIHLLTFYLGGVGTHIYDNSKRTLEYGLRLQFAGQIVYVVTSSAIKTSMFLFFLRLTPPKRKVMRRIVIGTIILLQVELVVPIIVAMTACKPSAAAWDLPTRVEKFDCINWQAYIVASSAIWSLMDVWALLMPIPLVWNLNLSNKKIIATLILFQIGAVACIASVVKIFFIKGVYNSWDPTWNSTGVLFWQQMELSLGLIAACLPSLSVIRFRFPRLSTSRLLGSKSTGRKSSFTSNMETQFSVAEIIHQTEKGYTEKKSNLILVPTDVVSADISTKVAAMNPLPLPEEELYLHYPRPKQDGDELQAPAPALWRLPETNPKKAVPGDAEPGYQVPSFEFTDFRLSRQPRSFERHSSNNAEIERPRPTLQGGNNRAWTATATTTMTTTETRSADTTTDYEKKEETPRGSEELDEITVHDARAVVVSRIGQSWYEE